MVVLPPGGYSKMSRGTLGRVWGAGMVELLCGVNREAARHPARRRTEPSGPKYPQRLG